MPESVRIHGSILALILAHAPLAFAQVRGEVSAEATPGGYREAIAEGVTEYEAGHWEEALALFHEAHTLFPNARTHRGVGITEFELRNYGECIKQLRAALASKVKPLEGVMRSETELLLARATSFVARINLDLTPGVARVIVDSVPVDVMPGQALVLSVGEHVLEVQSAGYTAERRAVTVKGGEEQALTIALSRPPRPEGLMATQPEGRRWYKNQWLWAAVGAVVVGGTTGALLAVKSGSGRETEAPTVTPNTPGSTLQALRSW